MQNVQFYRQHANGNHMSAQHYSIEYREGGKCVYPLVALSIFLYVSKRKECLCIILITKVFESSKMSWKIQFFQFLCANYHCTKSLFHNIIMKII